VRERGFRLSTALWTCLFILLLIRLQQVPPAWFDEGWMLSLARNWVEMRHYGYLLAGEPVPASILYTGLPAVAPIALSFRLLGIGLWQGRLPSILFILAAFGALYYLAHRLYGRSAATGMLACGLLLSPYPVLFGRQAIGEMPALFYLLIGYVFFLWTWRRPRWFLPLAVLSWGLSLQTKPQVLPFFIASLSLPLMLTLWQRRWRTTWLLALGLAGALIASGILAWAQGLLLSSELFSPTSGTDPYFGARDTSNPLTYAFVPILSIRLSALRMALTSGLPTLLGLAYAAGRFIRVRHELNLDAGRTLMRLILWSLIASWFAWYILFSNGWLRYLFPVVLLGSLFAAAFLLDVTQGFNWPLMMRRGPRFSGFTAPGLGRLLIATLIPAMILALLLQTTWTLYDSYVVSADDSVLEVARFLNTHTRPDARIETYDSELFFLLERPYHYPPDAVQWQLNRRAYFGQDIEIEYDPLLANPDYLVVGPMSRLWQLYAPALATGKFSPCYETSRYQVYERVP